MQKLTRWGLIALVPVLSFCGDDDGTTGETDMDPPDMVMVDMDTDMGPEDMGPDMTEDMGPDMPEVPLVSIAVDPATATLAPDATQALTVTGTFSDDSTLVLTSGISFASSDDTIATVDAAGLVTAVAAGEAAVLAELQDDGALVYFARCAFASLADPDVRSGDAPPRRRDRLADLAQQYPSVDLDNRPQLRYSILLLLSSDDHAAALLAEPLAEASSGLTLPAVMGQNFHRGNNRQQQLVLASMFAQLAQHDLEALGLQLDAIYAPNNSPNGNWESRNQHEAFRDVIRRGFIPGRGRGEDASAVTDAWTPDQLVAFADLWERAI